MKFVIQKSGPANVSVDGGLVGEIERGLVVLAGICDDDDEKVADFMLDKLVNLRLFDLDGKPFDKSVIELGLEMLFISQFTLYASCKKGRRPDFGGAARADKAEPLYDYCVERLNELGVKVSTGQFGAMMKVDLINEGPVTIILDSKEFNI